MTVRVGVIGAGAWGTALGHLMAKNGARVMMWAYEPEIVEEINTAHENRTFLPEVSLPETIGATNDMEVALEGKDLVILVSPSHVTRHVVEQAKAYLPQEVPIVCASKGIENDTLMTMAEVMEDVLPLAHHPMLAFLSGPSFAREVATYQPTAVSVAARYEKVAERTQQMMSAPYFRVYTSSDVMGVELGGALKNVMAIAAGAADGLGYGYNTVSALITRGLAEISRLAVKMGANPLTLSGLSGMGDLVLTCMGGLSRNRTVGQKLGQGQTLEQITKDMRQVAEGVKTAKSVYLLAQREGVEMPICTAVYRILYENLGAQEAVGALMSRTLKKEIQH